MAQFDVHKNPGANRELTPYVVVIQSKALEHTERRVVIPLIRASKFSEAPRKRLNPSFTVAGELVTLSTLDSASVPRSRLGKPVASLAAHGVEIIEAIDQLITRAHD